ALESTMCAPIASTESAAVRAASAVLRPPRESVAARGRCFRAGPRSDGRERRHLRDVVAQAVERRLQLRAFDAARRRARDGAVVDEVGRAVPRQFYGA